MENPLILVADADPKNLQILRDSLEASGFSVVLAQDGPEAWDKIQAEQPDMILSEVNLPGIDGFALLEKCKESPLTAPIPIMFLTTQSDLQNRIRGLRGGVKDYMIKPLHVKEVIARVRMILRRTARSRNGENDTSRKMAGRLEEYSVIELIENFGAERRTGILRVFNENNRNGEIWFRNGAVVHATFGTLKAENAVYQMLPWKTGHFVMTFKEIEPMETVSISNFGLLLHGFKRIEQRERLFKQLPSPETTFVITERFQKILQRQELSQEARKFLALIDGRHDIMQIIDAGIYDDIRTLERLVKLYRQGLIVPGKATAPTTTEINIALLKADDHSDRDQIVGFEEVAANKNAPEVPTDEPVRALDKPGADFPPPDIDALDEEEGALSPATGSFGPEDVSNQANADESDVDEQSASDNEEHADSTGTASQYKAGEEFSPSFNNKNEPTLEFEKAPPANGEATEKDATRRFDRSSPGPEENEIDKGSPESSLGQQVPKPCEIEAYAPHRDLIAALNLGVSGQDEEESKPEDSFEKTTEDQEIEPPTPAVDESAEAPDESNQNKESSESEADADSERQPESRSKITYSFPLRSYGKPRKVETPHRPKVGAENPPSSQPSTDNSKQEEVTTCAEPAMTEAKTPSKPDRPFSTLPQRRSAPITPGREGTRQPVTPDEHFSDLAHLRPAQQRPPAQAPAPASAPQALQIEKEQPGLDANLVQEAKTLFAALPGLKNCAHPRLVLIGSRKELITAMASVVLAGGKLKSSQSQVFEYFAAAEAAYSPNIVLTIIGVTMEKQFTRLLDKFATELIGYVLLIDASDRDKLEYIGYLRTALQENFSCPNGLAVFDDKERKNLSIDTIRDLIGAAPDDLVMKLNLEDPRTHLQFFREMFDEAQKNPDHR